MERWGNRVAVVTGATSGIGAACCKELLARGMVVLGLGRRIERIQQMVAQLPVEQQKRFHIQRCDVTNEKEIVSAFAWVDQHLGGADVLVNSAGILNSTIKIVDEKNGADLASLLNTNVLACALCTREAFRSMKRRGVNDGHILIISSAMGHMVPNLTGQHLNLYPASKFALTAMTEMLRQEFLTENTKIKITSISPGVVYTEFLTDVPDVPKEMALLQPEDVSDCVWYCIQTPPHVQVHDIIIKPVGESF